MRAGGDGPDAVRNGTSEPVVPAVPAKINPEGEINPPSTVGLLHFTEAPVDSMYRPPRLTPLLSHAERGLERLFGMSSGGNEEGDVFAGEFKPVAGPNGSTWYYAFADNKTVTVTGYLQEVVGPLHHLMLLGASPEDLTVYTSPATVVRHFDWEESDNESGEFASASGNVRVGWSRDLETDFYRFDIQYARSPSRTALESAIGSLADLIEHELTEVFASPFSLGNMSRMLERLLREAKDTQIVGMMKMIMADIDPKDVAAWHAAIHERPSGIAETRNINDGLAEDSDLFIRNVDVGIRIKEGLVSSVVWALNFGKGVLRVIASPRPDMNGLLWQRETVPFGRQLDENWVQAAFERFKGFAVGLFRDGLKQSNVADINASGVMRGNGGGGSVPPAAENGGGEGGGAGGANPPSGTPPTQEGKPTVTGLYYPEETEAFSDGFGNNFHYRHGHDRIGARARAAALRTVQPGRAIQRPIAAPIARSALMITM